MSVPFVLSSCQATASQLCPITGSDCYANYKAVTGTINPNEDGTCSSSIVGTAMAGYGGCGGNPCNSPCPPYYPYDAFLYPVCGGGGGIISWLNEMIKTLIDDDSTLPWSNGGTVYSYDAVFSAGGTSPTSYTIDTLPFSYSSIGSGWSFSYTPSCGFSAQIVAVQTNCLPTIQAGGNCCPNTCSPGNCSTYPGDWSCIGQGGLPGGFCSDGFVYEFILPMPPYDLCNSVGSSQGSYGCGYSYYANYYCVDTGSDYACQDGSTGLLSTPICGSPDPYYGDDPP
jgi:hypothetical protein